MTTREVVTIQVFGLNASVTRVEPSSAAVQPVPILFLHGWGVSSELMLPIAEKMANFGFRGIVPDFPGFGASEPPPVGWSVSDYTKWTICLLDLLKTEHVHLFAHSFGARISLYLGRYEVERIGKIALTGAAGIRSNPSLSSEIRLSLYKGLRSGLRKIGATELATQLSQWYGNLYGSADYLASSGVMRDTFLRVVNENLDQCAQHVDRPTLLFWGDQDEATPLWQGKKLEKLIPDAGLIVYKGGDHYAYLQHQVEIARTLDHFYRN